MRHWGPPVKGPSPLVVLVLCLSRPWLGTQLHIQCFIFGIKNDGHLSTFSCLSGFRRSKCIILTVYIGISVMYILDAQALVL